jgi:predicted anti-sigma-YlaC factor YlaD
MNHKSNCEQYQILLMQYVDQEISPENKQKLEDHLNECSSCREELEKFIKIKGVNSTMKNKLLPDMAWDEYWRHLYNRMERGISWIFISIGAIILLGIAVYSFIIGILNESHMTLLEKIGILALAFGFVVLFVSVVREKLMTSKHDKYKEIVR